MVSRRGATRRRRIPKQEVVEEPPLTVACTCCHCEATFSPFDVLGAYLDRRCPSCGGVLVESEYDASAAAVLRDMEKISAPIDENEKEIERWHIWAYRFRWGVFFLLRRLFERKSEAAVAKRAVLKEQVAVKRTRLGMLARSRYYTGEWFQRTHVPLERTVVGPYKITVAYGVDGSWNINPTSKLTSGIIAEIRVFQELLKRVRDSESGLCGAQIVPNIYLPHEQQGRKAEKFWSQIDCVLLTRQAAFVIESKRRRKDIVAPDQFEEIWSTTNSRLMESYNEGTMECSLRDAGFEDESFALRQNSKHAVEFDEVCQKYPYERIYEQVVYVGTDSFSADYREFIDNVNVSWVGRGRAEFADIIESECGQLDEIVSQRDLDTLGESLIQQYGDLNQKRGQLHTERLKSIRHR